MDRDWLLHLIPLVIGLSFFAVGVHGIRRARHLRRTGAKAYGHIVRHNTGSGENGTIYRPVAAWQTPDGRWHEYVSDTGSSAQGRFKVGAQVVVHYDAADPERAAIEGYDGGRGDWVFTIVGVGLTVGSLFFTVAARLSG